LAHEASLAVAEAVSTARLANDERDQRGSHTSADVLVGRLGRGARGSGLAHAGDSGDAKELGPADTARFVGRVARAFHFAQERGGTLQLRLSPPELGSLRLALTVKDGVLSASLETETPAARRLLLDHLPALRDRLAEQNVRVERFDVEVRRDGSEGSSDPSHQQHQQQQQRQEDRPAEHPPSTSRAAQPTSPGDDADHAVQTTSDTSRLNLVA